jgi:nitrate reductase gamma subunit
MYLIGAMFFFNLLWVVLSILQLPLLARGFLLGLASVFAIVGYLLGAVGTIGLILKRALNSDLRPFSTLSTFGHLLFLTVVFVSGAVAWYYWRLSDLGLFIRGLIFFDRGLALAPSLSFHIVVVLLFLLYLPFTNMIHFVAKYFMYHGIRWNDGPQDNTMRRALNGLLGQPVAWSASHVEADGKKSWLDLAAEKRHDETP